MSIPNSVTTIEDNVFKNNTSLTYVEIPDGITSIGNYAFSGCTSLKSLIIPNNVGTIGKYAFQNCSGLTSVTIIANSFTYYPATSFEGCTGVTTLTLECGSISSISKNFTTVQNLTLGSGVTTVASDAFSGYTDLRTLNLNCKEVGSWFSGLTSLEDVTFGDNVTSIVSNAFSGCTSLKSISIPDGVTSIEGSTFSGCTGLTSVTIPEGVTTIGESAFRNCENLASLTLPNSLTSIGISAFYGCKNLKTLTIPNRVSTIGDYAFYNTYLNSLTLGAGVRSIGGSAFSYNYNDGYRPAKVFWMTNTPPSGYRNGEGMINYVSNDLYTELNNIKVYPYLSSMFEVDGVKYVLVNPSERTCDAVDCVYDERNAIVDIKAQTTYRTVSLAVKNMQPFIFYGNTFVQNSTVEIGGDISEYAFFGCSNMQKAVFGNTGNKDLNEFTGCFIGENVNNVADYAFSGCAKLNNLIINDREEGLTLGSNGALPLFDDCPFDSVYIGGDISYQITSDKGYSPFYRNTWLRTVVITDKETEVSPNEFYGCTNLQDFTVGDGVTTFGDWCFSGCLSLKKLSFGTQLAEIGREAFSDCTAITQIVSKTSTPPVCGTQAMDDINKWDCTLYVPVGSEVGYRAADQWKEFFFVTEGTGEEGGNPQAGEQQCATPTIAILNGKLVFECETPGVIYHYQLYMTAPEQNVGNHVSIPSRCAVKVYASKDGYTDSPSATKMVDINALKGDVNGDGEVTPYDASLILQYLAKKINW